MFLPEESKNLHRYHLWLLKCITVFTDVYLYNLVLTDKIPLIDAFITVSLHKSVEKVKTCWKLWNTMKFYYFWWLVVVLELLGREQKMAAATSGHDNKGEDNAGISLLYPERCYIFSSTFITITGGLQPRLQILCHKYWLSRSLAVHSYQTNHVQVPFILVIDTHPYWYV